MPLITVRSSVGEEMIDISSEVEERLPGGDGICVLLTQHTTCGITINENADPFRLRTEGLVWVVGREFTCASSMDRGSGSFS